MRCKACDVILKETNAIWRTVEVEGKAVRMMEDLCPSCRADTDADPDDPIPPEIREIFEREMGGGDE